MEFYGGGLDPLYFLQMKLANQWMQNDDYDSMIFIALRRVNNGFDRCTSSLITVVLLNIMVKYRGCRMAISAQQSTTKHIIAHQNSAAVLWHTLAVALVWRVMISFVALGCPLVTMIIQALTNDGHHRPFIEYSV